ncbi:GTPase activating protein (GAP) for Rho1p [Malassezia obtusa]|uniref:GTPase activating protein (GAP) for Rho1p n=1 Tax=Malassezia obtusa TaxID=76774 RepID=A0AAF0E1V4_9BASI|nr:GTPase activating protein (GAP) for Rho1p [Malassezia obtusa]
MTGLRSWWSSFARPPAPREERSADETSMFGAPLHEALKHSSVAISLVNQQGEQYVWGYIPAIVAKIGLFLKQNATDVEGVFRINGSEKRMKGLRQQFDTPPEYGKDVDWEGYNVHDAATLLRRFLNLMPEPIIPVDRFREFRDVLAKPNVDEKEAIASYRQLITSCPPATQYLLLYILDLLAVFERTSDVNKMTANNLAILFQPGMLTHPSVRSREDHQFAVRVVEFLITHQDHFVLALSEPPPENMPPEELAKPKSKARVDHYLLVPSDSDEDLGEMEAHVGGGAMLGRRSSVNSARRRERRPRRERRRSSHEAESAAASAIERRESLRPKPVRELRKDGRKRANSHSDAHEQAVLSRRASDAGPSSAPPAPPPPRSAIKHYHTPPPTLSRPPLGKRSASATSWMETVPQAASRGSPLQRTIDSPVQQGSAQSPSALSSPRSSLPGIETSSASRSSRGGSGSSLESRTGRPMGMTIVTEASVTEPEHTADSEQGELKSSVMPTAEVHEQPPTPPEKDIHSILRATATEPRMAAAASPAPVPPSAEHEDETHDSATVPLISAPQDNPPPPEREETPVDSEPTPTPPSGPQAPPSVMSTLGLSLPSARIHEANSRAFALDEVSPGTVPVRQPLLEGLSPIATLPPASFTTESGDDARDAAVSQTQTDPASRTSLPSPYPIDARLAQLGPVVGAHSAPEAPSVPVKSVDDAPLRAAAAIPYATTNLALHASPTPVVVHKGSLHLRHARVTYTIRNRRSDSS